MPPKVKPIPALQVFYTKNEDDSVEIILRLKQSDKHVELSLTGAGIFETLKIKNPLNLPIHLVLKGKGILEKSVDNQAGSSENKVNLFFPGANQDDF